jgi:hypothetical protein
MRRLKPIRRRWQRLSAKPNTRALWRLGRLGWTTTTPMAPNHASSNGSSASSSALQSAAGYRSSSTIAKLGLMCCASWRRSRMEASAGCCTAFPRMPRCCTVHCSWAFASPLPATSPIPRARWGSWFGTFRQTGSCWRRTRRTWRRSPGVDNAMSPPSCAGLPSGLRN